MWFSKGEVRHLILIRPSRRLELGAGHVAIPFIQVPHEKGVVTLMHHHPFRYFRRDEGGSFLTAAPSLPLRLGVSHGGVGLVDDLLRPSRHLAKVDALVHIIVLFRLDQLQWW